MSWYDAVKLANEAAEKLHDAELNRRIALVMTECAKLAEENARIREELLTLRETTRLRAQMVLKENVYWSHTESGEDGPYCPACWDGGNKPVRLLDEDDYKLHCPVCKQSRWKPDGRERWRAGGDAGRRARGASPWVRGDR